MLKIRAATLIAIGCFGLFSYWYRTNVQNAQDINVYERIANSMQAIGNGEDVALESEYPPLASALFGIVHQIPIPQPFGIKWLYFLVFAIAASSYYAYMRLDKRDALLIPFSLTLSVILLSQELLVARFDVVIALLLLIAWRSLRKNHEGTGWFFLVVAAACKVLPGFLAPLFFVFTSVKKRGSMFVGIATGIAASLILPLMILGPGTMLENIQYFLHYQGDRGIQVETTWSGVNMLWHALQGEKAELGFHHLALHNQEMGPRTVYVSYALWIIGILGITWLAYARKKKTKSEQIDAYLIATILWILGVSSILSPQFLVWVIPILVLWLLERWWEPAVDRRTIWITVWAIVLALGTQWIYPQNYGEFADQRTLSIILIHNLRNLSFFVLIYLLLAPVQTHASAMTRRVKMWTAKHAKPVALGILAALIFLVGTLWGQTTLRFGNVSYQFADLGVETTEMPFFVDTKADTLTARFAMQLGYLHPQLFRIKPDDCLESMKINGIEVDSALIQFCDYGDGRTVHLGDYIAPGVNEVEVILADSGGLGGLNITSARTDALILLRNILILLLIGVALWFGSMSSKSNARKTLLSLFIGGTVVRTWHMLATHYNTRGHDTGAHLDYVEYVMARFRIPPAVEGWEYHQPPLYYFFAGAIGKIARLAGATMEQVWSILQATSLLFSIITYGFILWIGKQLFPENKDHNKLFLFSLLLMAFPPFVYLTSRISNDSLYQLIAVAFFAFLLRFWKMGSMRDWYIIVGILVLGILTKVSAYALGPVAVLCLLFHKKIPLKKKISTTLLSGVIIVLLAGWLPVMRLMEDDPNRTLTLGNEGMSSGLLVQTKRSAFLTFHPGEILKHPFNNTWIDEERRQYFWEFFFRSAFFDEFTFPDKMRSLAVSILFFALLGLPLIALGLVHELRKRWYDTFPLWFTTALLLASSLSYRLRFPYAPNQDFRFVVLLAIPLAYFAIQGIDVLPPGLRRIATGILWMVAVLCTAFIVVLYFYG